MHVDVFWITLEFSVAVMLIWGLGMDLLGFSFGRKCFLQLLIFDNMYISILYQKMGAF